MKKAIIILLLFAVTAQISMAQEYKASKDIFFRLSTGLRVGSPVPRDYLLNWTVGVDLGVGIWYGPLHAGVAGGIKIPALWMLLAYTASHSNTYSGNDTELNGYIDFPVRFYTGFRSSGRKDFQFDAFF